MTKTTLRWEPRNGVLVGYRVDADEPDSKGPCPVCRRRHRIDLVEGTDMNTLCFTIAVRLRERASQRQ